MTLLKDLLDLKAQQAAKQTDAIDEETQLTEARSLSDMIEKWTDQNKMYSFEGPRGVRNLQQLVGVLDYRSLEAFFEDNSGAIEAVIEWIGGIGNLEWRQAFEDELDMEDDDEDDDDK